MYTSKKASTNIAKIVENGKEPTNPVEIADTLNTFYVNIGNYELRIYFLP